MFSNETIPITLETICKKFQIHKNYSKDLVIRCPYCGDSVKNPRSCHMYISKVPVHGMYKCHCFRCGTVKDLLVFLVENSLIKFVPKNEIKKIYEADSTISFSKKLSTTPYKLIPLQKENKKDQSKIKYIENRIGKIPKQIKKYIITSFHFERNEKKRQWLENEYVGFVTYLRKKVICRNIRNQNPRYMECSLLPQQDFFLFFGKDKLELLSQGSIYISEGIFSLIGGYKFLKSNNIFESNSILVSAGGEKSITSCLRFVRSLFGVPDWNVILFGDSDIDYSSYIKKIRNARFFSSKILYNKHGEDFGEKEVKDFIQIIA